MRITSNDKNIKKLELINPVSGVWAVRWDIIPEDKDTVSYEEEILYHEPSKLEIKDMIEKHANNTCKDNIFNNFVWNDHQVYLNEENQGNISKICPAVIDNPTLLPITLKFGSSVNSEYYTFDTVEEVKDFYAKMAKHINNCLAKCWETKKSINLEEYK